MNKTGKYSNLKSRITKLLEEDSGQSVKELAEKLGINRIFLAGYLKALEDQGYVKVKRIGPAKVYFKENNIMRC